jgi:hypothetical protein
MKTAYSYAECLQNSYRVNWKIGDVVDGRHFDVARRWLPTQLSAADSVTSLSEEEKRKLSHVEMGAYAHLFGFLEEFIAPKMLGLAQDFQLENRDAFDALTNFAAEEIKHMALFRELRGRIDAALGFPLTLLPGAKDVARVVLSKANAAVLLFTDAGEWMTLMHYHSCFKDNEALDPFTRHIFKAHWLEESQHARMDHLETLRAFEGMSDHDRQVAIEDLIELFGAADGLLQKQSELDVENFERYLGRSLAAEQRKEVYARVLQAKRYTFIESGVRHPNFVELFESLTTPKQQAQLQKALTGLLRPSAA